MSLPPGIRDNNPGNLRIGPVPWDGQGACVRPDFCYFHDPVMGVRALMKDLLAYQNKHNIHSIRGVCTRWAPPNENNTTAYILDCCARVGIGPDDFLNLSVRSSLIRTAQAIVHHENGACPDPTLPHWYADEIYEQAAGLALGETDGQSKSK